MPFLLKDEGLIDQGIGRHPHGLQHIIHVPLTGAAMRA